MATESIYFNSKSIVGATSVVVGSSYLPQPTLQATGTTTLIGNVFVQGGILYPPGPMTANTTTLSGFAYGNGTYVAFAPEQSNPANAFRAFDGDITTVSDSVSASGFQVYNSASPYNYSNTTITGGFSNTFDVTSTNYPGVYIQLQMPPAVPLVLEYYTIFPGANTLRAPGTWRVFGSTTGAIGTWVSLDSQAGITWQDPQVSQTFYLSPVPVAYFYFRLSVQNLAGNTQILNVSQWNLYGRPPVPAMSILGGDLAISSGGGLSVGSGTLGSNVFIFSNTAGATSNNVMGMDSNATVLIGIQPSSNVNYGGAQFYNAKARLYVAGGGTASQPMNIVLYNPNLTNSNQQNGICFGGGGGASWHLISSYDGGGRNNFILGGDSGGGLNQYHRFTATGLCVNSQLGVAQGPNVFHVLGFSTSNIAYFSNVAGGSNVVVINSNAWVGIGTSNPSAPLTVNGNATFLNDTIAVPFATMGTLSILSGATIGASSTVLGSNLMVLANVSGGSNVTVFTGNTVGISNLAPATTLSVGGTISALGNATTFGTLAPVTWRQGTASSTNWSIGTGVLSNYGLGALQVQIQCGSNTIPASTLTQVVTFPSPYVNNPIVMVTPYALVSTFFVSAVSGTSFTLTIPSTATTVPFEWMSIGI